MKYISIISVYLLYYSSVKKNLSLAINKKNTMLFLDLHILFMVGYMEIKKIDTTVQKQTILATRPDSFSDFVWQSHIKQMLQTAIVSAKKRNWPLWHILFSWPSWFWKTTMAHIIAEELWVKSKVITDYAISKPSEIVSILNALEQWDILFIDEIHRLKPNVEEVLYTAMEDFVIDMVMPEWGNVRIPINPFTLIWATTKPEMLSKPMKNRFVYSFHLAEYTNEEKAIIIERYLQVYGVSYDKSIPSEIAKKVDSVPREIHNLCIKIRDYCVEKWIKNVTEQELKEFFKHAQIHEWGLTPLHERYLEVMAQYDRPIGVKVIAAQLWVNEKAVEEDIEPLLLKLWKIEKTQQWRVLSWWNIRWLFDA